VSQQDGYCVVVTETLDLGDAIASQVRKYRLLKNWSVRQLAEECERLGAPQLTAASLANIERGQDPDAKRPPRRVLVEELAVLARALKVPPILLMLPIGQPVQVEPVPGQPLTPWQAATWWAGDRSFPSRDTRDGEAFFMASAPVAYYRNLDLLIDEWAIHRPRHDSEESRQRRHELEQRLRDLRQNMRRAGVDPGELPPFLAHLEDPKGVEHGGSDQAD